MPLIVELPGPHINEQRYVAHCLLWEFLGIDHHTVPSAADAVRIHDGTGRELTITADLFKRRDGARLAPSSLPRELLTWLDVAELPCKLLGRQIPVLYGNASLSRCEESIRLEVDVFGGSFFFLARLEEAIEKQRDRHDRFFAAHSLASRYGLLHRPVVDEYVELLWGCLHILWPGLERKRRSFKQNLTHDVDLLRYCLPQSLAGDLRRRRLDRAASDLRKWFSIRLGRMQDPCDTFDTIMDISEAAGTTSVFYFITGWTNPLRDFRYFFDRRSTRALLKCVNGRGHEIGLHPSYNTYLNSASMARELTALRRVCSKMDIKQERWGGRQHYLRWRTPDTFQHCEDAGLNYDSTLGFADVAGFRCGTCHEFPTFNVSTGQMLKLRERPLIAADFTVIDEPYQNLGATAAALQCFKTLKDICRFYDGEFTLLWHTNRLADPLEAALYRAVVAC